MKFNQLRIQDRAGIELRIDGNLPHSFVFSHSDCSFPWCGKNGRAGVEPFLLSSRTQERFRDFQTIKSSDFKIVLSLFLKKNYYILQRDLQTYLPLFLKGNCYALKISKFRFFKKKSVLYLCTTVIHRKQSEHYRMSVLYLGTGNEV